MRTFIDLLGASGAAYRFRKAETLSPTGGNFVYVREVDGKPRVVCCGTARTLSVLSVPPTWYRDKKAQPDDQLFIRLNAASSIRQAEHEDLIAGLPEPFAIQTRE